MYYSFTLIPEPASLSVNFFDGTTNQSASAHSYNSEPHFPSHVAWFQTG